MKRKVGIIIVFILGFFLAACTYNPFQFGNNDTTGSAAGVVIGASAGAGTIAALNGARYPIALAGILGGALGYYSTTLRFAAGGVVQVGGLVYTVGDVVGIYIPTDLLFEVNTSDLTVNAVPALTSAAQVLARYPHHNIIISGNTSGFSRPRREQRLSEERAAKIASFFWNVGINNVDSPPGIHFRSLQYTGYGDLFPIATRHRNDGIRQNSRVQIIAYPSYCDLGIDRQHMVLHNIGGLYSDDMVNDAPL